MIIHKVIVIVKTVRFHELGILFLNTSSEIVDGSLQRYFEIDRNGLASFKFLDISAVNKRQMFVVT